MSASNTIKIPSQARDLNMEPDPQEPSFSYEEKLINQSPLLSVRDEDELYRLTVRANQRIRNGAAIANYCNGHSNHNNSISSNGPEFNSSEMKPVLRNSVINFDNDVSGLRSSSNVVSVILSTIPYQYSKRIVHELMSSFIVSSFSCVSFPLGYIEVLRVCL